MAGFFSSREGVGLSKRQFKTQLNRVYCWYTAGLVLFVVVLAGLERMGMPRLWIGSTFLRATIGLYAGIGIMSRTTDAAEYYVAGRRVPAVYNGMATGADWMSAASFIGLAGTLYLTGYSGLAFIIYATGFWASPYALRTFYAGPTTPARLMEGLTAAQEVSAIVGWSSAMASALGVICGGVIADP